MRVSGRQGFSLIELLIVAAVMALFIGGLFVTIQTSLKLISESRARMSALSVANDRIEYIRSLSYDVH
jgi:prepilin-type N-terminal cleavage/methylation domain-containing protein